MANRIIIDSTGTADVMQLEHVQAQPPGPGQVWLEQTAMGVNPLDVLQRKGGAPLALPSGLGLEGAGRVAAIGEGVPNVHVGDRVAYAMGPVGAYASGRLFYATTCESSVRRLNTWPGRVRLRNLPIWVGIIV